MSFIDRRDFLHDSAALAAALAGVGLFGETLEGASKKKAVRKKGDANDTLHVAVIGVHGRGRDHVGGFAGKHNCVVTTICDADEAVIGKAMKAAEGAQGKAPRFVQDLRKVMDDSSIDVVSIATPNHWHALAAIWALQAGKHVYVEKPVSHNVSEGRRIVEVAHKAKRVCQTGTQSRSSKGMREAIQFLHDGKLGKIKLARGICYKLRGSIGKVKGPQPVPKTVDYNLWCGPAPKKPLMRKHLHYDWHWIWDYGNGDLGNQGIHEMDKARWGLGKNELAKSVLSIGGRFGYVDDGETANTQICVFDYGDCELIFEVRGLPSVDPFPGKHYGQNPHKAQNFVGNVWYGTEGYLVAPSYSHAAAFTKEGELIKKFTGGGDHYGNFVKAVRSNKPELLSAPILEGHLSSALCHLGNVSYRLGKMKPFNKKGKAFGDDKEAAETLLRTEDHLKENKVPLDKTPCRVGRKLAFDPKGEKFVHDKDADALLTRKYREGFVVPAKA
jgi:predicted dehydrogenase